MEPSQAKALYNFMKISLLFATMFIMGISITNYKNSNYYKEKEEMAKIRLKKDLFIKAGTELESCGHTTVTYGEDDFEFTADGQLDLYINKDMVDKNPDKFEILED